MKYVFWRIPSRLLIGFNSLNGDAWEITPQEEKTIINSLAKTQLSNIMFLNKTANKNVKKKFLAVLMSFNCGLY